mgnify:CR=1 FL=1
MNILKKRIYDYLDYLIEVLLFESQKYLVNE